MTEEALKQALTGAYPSQPLADDRITLIAGRIRLSTAKRRRREITGLAGLAFAVVATVGFTYPIAAANLFGLQMGSKMEAMSPYLVQLSVLSNDTPGAHWNHRSSKIIVDGSEEFILDSNESSKTFIYIDSSKQMHVVHTASKVDVVYPPQKDVDGFYRMPITIMDSLSDPTHLDFRKRIEDRGLKTVNRRKVRELAMKTGGKEDFVADLDAQTDALVSMTIPSISISPQQAPPLDFGMRFDYSFDANNLKKTTADLRPIISNTRELMLDRDRLSIREELFRKPPAAKSTGRDLLRIYEVQEDSLGDVFVLYSCDGYHADDDNVGDWLQLKDSTGRAWLTALIDMNFSKLAPKGVGLKAQVFINPEPSDHAGLARLSIRLNEWEYLRANEPSTPSTRTLGIGSFVPTKVYCVPIWYFYAFGVSDEAWVKAIAEKLRFKHALATKKYRQAIDIGNAFDGWIPEDMTGLWFTRADLYHGLALAYAGIGDVKNASRYHAKSAELNKLSPSGGDPDYYEDSK